MVAPALRAVPPSLLSAAAVMGRSRRARWWEVELPAVRGAVAAGAGLAFVACLGEFGAPAFVVRSDRPTLPVLVARLLGRPGAAGYGQAMALSCVLVVVCAVVLGLVDRAGRGTRPAARSHLPSPAARQTWAMSSSAAPTASREGVPWT